MRQRAQQRKTWVGDAPGIQTPGRSSQDPVFPRTLMSGSSRRRPVQLCSFCCLEKDKFQPGLDSVHVASSGMSAAQPPWAP